MHGFKKKTFGAPHEQTGNPFFSFRWVFVGIGISQITEVHYQIVHIPMIFIILKPAPLGHPYNIYTNLRTSIFGPPMIEKVCHRAPLLFRFPKGYTIYNLGPMESMGPICTRSPTRLKTHPPTADSDSIQ